MKLVKLFLVLALIQMLMGFSIDIYYPVETFKAHLNEHSVESKRYGARISKTCALKYLQSRKEEFEVERDNNIITFSNQKYTMNFEAKPEGFRVYGEDGGPYNLERMDMGLTISKDLNSKCVKTIESQVK